MRRQVLPHRWSHARYNAPPRITRRPWTRAQIVETTLLVLALAVLALMGLA